MIESKQIAGLIRHALEGAEDHLDLDRNRRRRLIRIADREALETRGLSCNACDLAEEGRVTRAALRRLFESLGTHLCNDLASILEPFNALRRQPTNLLGSSLKDDVRAVQADDVAQLLNPVEELVEIHGSSKRDVTEVTGTELVRVLAGGTDLAVLNDSEARIKDTVRHRLSRLIGFVGGNLHDAPLENVVGVCDSELNSGDCVSHVYFLYCSLQSIRFRNESERGCPEGFILYHLLNHLRIVGAK